MSIGRNLFLGREPTRSLGPFRSIDRAYVERTTRELMNRVGIMKAIDSRTPIASLSGGERQAIAIARAMFFEADLIVMDEPTNNLGVEEADGVMRFIREAKEAGHSSVLISHNIHHVFQVVDRIVVLRLGLKVGDMDRTRRASRKWRSSSRADLDRPADDGGADPRPRADDTQEERHD